MRNGSFFILGLCIMVFGLFGCTVDTPAPVASTPTMVTNSEILPEIIATEVIAPAPVPTSRGDKLEASDPGTFRKNSGRPVLIEFFRYT